MRTPTAARLAVLRDMVHGTTGDITTAAVKRLYVTHFGPADWQGKARQDLAQLVDEGLLILDDTDPGRRCYRRNYAHGGTHA